MFPIGGRVQKVRGGWGGVGLFKISCNAVSVSSTSAVYAGGRVGEGGSISKEERVLNVDIITRKKEETKKPQGNFPEASDARIAYKKLQRTTSPKE